MSFFPEKRIPIISSMLNESKNEGHKKVINKLALATIINLQYCIGHKGIIGRTWQWERKQVKGRIM